MTIIKSQKNKYTKFFMVFFAVLVVASIGYVFEYNSLVDLRHEARELGERIVSLKTENAELKNAFYELTDPGALQAFAYEYDLILDERPVYLSYEQR